jgi:hypothetical protein
VIALCFVLDDLRYYWYHRIAHRCRWVWAEHVNHHSSQHYNLSTALRQSWTGTFTGMFILRIPLALIGFHPVLLLFVGGLNLVYQFWIHTEAIGRMWKPIEWIFNTPSHHRVHHATNPRYLDSNYAGTLIIWDRMFGTFVPELDEDMPRYGIVKNIGTFNPVQGRLPRMDRHVQGCVSARSEHQAAAVLPVCAAGLEPRRIAKRFGTAQGRLCGPESGDCRDAWSAPGTARCRAGFIPNGPNGSCGCRVGAKALT